MRNTRGRRRGRSGTASVQAALDPKLAVLLCRISSEDQKKSFSPDSQERAGRDYATRMDFTIAKLFQLTESAFKEDERRLFGEFMRYVETTPVKHVLFPRVDRSLRNLTDLTRLEKLAKSGKTLHFFQDGFLYHENSTASDFFRLGIQGVVAATESLQISERTRRCLREKAKQGGWPQRAPFGYKNIGEEDEKKRVEPDPGTARWVVRIKELAATSRYSIDAIVVKLKDEGCTVKLTRNLVERTIRNPFASGRFQWGGEWCEGKHPPLVTWDLHLAAVRGLERLSKPKYRVHSWPYSGLVQCAACGRAVVFELKTKKLKDGSESKHTYCHCAGIRRGPGGGCGGDYLRGDEYENALGAVVAPVSITPSVAEWLLDKIASGSDYEAVAMETELATLRRELTKLGTFIERAYTDKLEGRIAEEFWLQQTRRWQEQQFSLEEKIKAMEASGPDSYLALARRVLEPVISLKDKYFSLDPHERAEILRTVCSNLKLDQKRIVPTYRTPYGALVSGNDSKNWLRD